MQKSSPLSAPTSHLYGYARYTLYYIYPLFCYLKDGAKVAHSFEMCKYVQGYRGSSMRKVVPRPGSEDFTQIRPWW